MNGFEFDIFWVTGEAYELHKLGHDIPLEQAEFRKLTFFNFNYIKPYDWDGVELCTICSGGTEYITNLTYKQVKERIEK